MQTRSAFLLAKFISLLKNKEEFKMTKKFGGIELGEIFGDYKIVNQPVDGVNHLFNEKQR